MHVYRTLISRFYVGWNWMRKHWVESQRALSRIIHKNISLAWILILPSDFKPHASLHQCRACRDAFHGRAAQGKGGIVERMYIEGHHDTNLLDLQTFERFHRAFLTHGSLYVSRSDTKTEWYRRICALEEAELHTIEPNISKSSKIAHVRFV